jgi:hypothetical protein
MCSGERGVDRQAAAEQAVLHACDVPRHESRRLGIGRLTHRQQQRYNISMEAPSTKGRCPLNGQPGHRVARQTLQSLLLVDLRLVTEEFYWFCSAPTCPVAYFNDAGSITFSAEQVRVPIWHKQQDDPAAPICYCFKFTNQMLRDELEQTGSSSIAAQITAGIQRGLCACAITNPQGSCCLGNVRRATKAAQSHVANG